MWGRPPQAPGCGLVPSPKPGGCEGPSGALWSLGADIKVSDCTGYWQRQPYGKDTPIHKMDKIGKSASVEQKWGNGEESHARVKGKPGLEDHQEATAPRMWTR